MRNHIRDAACASGHYGQPAGLRLQKRHPECFVYARPYIEICSLQAASQRVRLQEPKILYALAKRRH